LRSNKESKRWPSKRLRRITDDNKKSKKRMQGSRPKELELRGSRRSTKDKELSRRLQEQRN
jgi:hypothetical protein